jgi:hypothetical protein
MRRGLAPEKSFELTFIKDCKILFSCGFGWAFRARRGVLLALTNRVIYHPPQDCSAQFHIA